MNEATFDPGSGWRPLGLGETTTGREYIEHGTPDETLGVWVRVDPVPPLPTEPWTVVRVTWRDARQQSELMLWPKDRRLTGWQPVSGTGVYAPGYVQQQITGFEVIAEPVDHGTFERGYEAGVRAAADPTYVPQLRTEFGVDLPDLERVRVETARAVLDRVRAYYPDGDGNALDGIAREFGVEA